MQPFTLSIGAWLRRLTTRNPLVRRSDRIEAVALLVVLATVILAAPVAGAVGTAVHDSRAQEVTAGRLSRHTVQATVTRDSSMAGWPYEQRFRTTIQWQFKGTVHSDEWRSMNWRKAGDKQSIWIDAVGNRAAEPLSGLDAAIEAAVVAFGLWLAVVGIGTTLWIILRTWLDRSRNAGWDRALNDLADDGGRTSRNS